ncbi:MAG: restriction endonuclease subunit S [Thermomicrobiales bacterium]|nr:restriction endonuclease subunit S [Thermomicrobiales bacterium]
MIGPIQRHSEYKDSTISWLGEIPSHWQVQRIKSLADAIIGGSTPSSNERKYWDGEIVWVTPQDISRSLRLRRSRRTITQEGLESISAMVVPAGSLVLSSRAPVGNVSIAEVPLATNQGCKAIVPNKSQVDSEFLLVLLPLLKNSLNSVSSGSTFVELSATQLGDTRLAVPPLDEQAAIVKYLAHVDDKINRFIRAKRRLIELLNEQKQALIHQAVTKGLDPNVPMKDSGVERLGEIPAHWNLRPLGRFIVLQRGIDITKDQQVEGDFPVISSGGVSSFHNSGTSKGPGVLLGRKGSVGTVHYSPGPYWAHDTTLWVREFGQNHPRFIYYLLLNLDLKRFDTGSSNPTINRNIVHTELVAVPDFAEQAEIASEVDGKLEAIANGVEKSQKEIDLLREYRTRLVSDVVTGKLDVREAAAPLPEIEAEFGSSDDEIDPVSDEEDAEEDVNDRNST